MEEQYLKLISELIDWLEDEHYGLSATVNKYIEDHYPEIDKKMGENKN